MRKGLAFVLAFSLGIATLAVAAGAPAAQDQSSYQAYSPDQLDNLLAPIALYPDPLLAQVLVAATFPDQIDEAARFVRSYGQNGVDDQPWDVSVRAVAHYPTVLNMMDDQLDWTTAVGQAYVYQSTDVMTSIQRLRAMAEQQGNLVSTPQQQVVEENGEIGIWPASPQYIYVPVYDPSIVFFRRAYYGGFFTGFSFGPGLVIGAWLNRDFDWRRRRVYYTGWQGSGWIGRSRPYVQVNSIYVNRRFTNIVINRNVVQRPVNYEGLTRYQSVHPSVNFQGRAGASMPARTPVNRVPNKIIDRNIMPNQPINQFRGWQQPAPVTRAAPQPARSFPAPQRPAQQPRTFQPLRPPAQTGQPPRGGPPAQVQRAPAAQPGNAFGRGNDFFNARAASQRGQQSRSQMNPKPAAPSAPRVQPRTSQPAPKSQQPASRPASGSQGRAERPPRR
jgi:Protein of unknown function (DUF3300)